MKKQLLNLFLFLLGIGSTLAQTYHFAREINGSPSAQFAAPNGVAVDASGNVYVADFRNGCILKFDGSGNFLIKWGSPGVEDGEFAGPVGVAVDAFGNVYVAEETSHRIQKFDGSGNFVTKWGGQGSGNGKFFYPVDVAVDASGNVYVVEIANNRIQKFDGSGNFLTKWGSEGSGNGQFLAPNGLAVDASGNVYVLEIGNKRIQKFDGSGNFVTKWGSQGSGNGQFINPRGVAVDASSNVYVTDNFTGLIQKFDSSGNFVTKWYSQGPSDVLKISPSGVAVNASGNVYVTDNINNRVKLFTSTFWYLDADRDGYYVGGTTIRQENSPGPGFVTSVIAVDDCDDSDNTKHTTFPFYIDADQDGHGARGQLPILVCAVNASTPPLGYSTDGIDCDDNHPGKITEYIYYEDIDRDGNGSDRIAEFCTVEPNLTTAPIGYSNNNFDCDDFDATKRRLYTFYLDADGDGYGTGTSNIYQCALDANTPPLGYSATYNDCNDNSVMFTISCPSYWSGTEWINGSPSNSKDVVIAGNYSGGSFESQKLTVNTGSTLSVANGTTLEVSDSLINNGTVVIQNSGNLIVYKTYGTGTWQDKTNQSASANVYGYISSPMQNFNISNLSGSNKYAFNTAGNNWTNASGIMTPGKGYIATAIGSATFTGKPNLEGTVTYPVSTAGQAYNLVGNPYTHTIAANNFINWNSTVISGTLWFWDQASNSDYSSADYATYTLAGGVAGGGGNVPSGTITTSLGFFVQAISNGNVKYSETSLPLSARLSEAEQYSIKLNIVNPKSDFNQLMIAFRDDATDGVDPLLDGAKFSANPNLSFASILNAKTYAIQALPLLSNNKTVALSLNAGVSGLHRIAVDTIQNIPAHFGIYLQDKQNGSLTNLRTNSSYTTSVTTGNNQERFSVLFVYSTITSAEEIAINEQEVSIYSSDSYIHLLLGDKTAEKIEIINSSGQSIKTIEHVGAGHIAIPINNEAKGIYIVRVNTNDKVKIGKVIVQ